MGTETGAVGTLTDGQGISKFTTSKIVKDLVLDAVMTGSAALVAAGINSIDAAIAAPQVALTAVAGALIMTGVRAVLRWAQS